jgi:hypothetical protein
MTHLELLVAALTLANNAGLRLSVLPGKSGRVVVTYQTDDGAMHTEVVSADDSPRFFELLAESDWRDDGHRRLRGIRRDPASARMVESRRRRAAERSRRRRKARLLGLKLGDGNDS